jgi:hypothetical protein
VVRKYSQTQLKTVQILRYTFSKMDRLLNGLLQDDIRAPRVDGSFARRLTFQPTKCCALHESPLRRAATQHPQVDVNGSNGPFMSIDTKGGMLTSAASAPLSVQLREVVIQTCRIGSYEILE